MAEPQLFPNQPAPQEHAQKHDKHQQESNNIATNNLLNSVATKLKIIEERYATMRRKSQITEQNIIENEKEQFQEFTLIGDDVMELKHKVKELAEKISMLQDELAHFARKDEIDVVQRYINYWNPIDYVTRKEVNAFLRKKFKEEKRHHASSKPQ
jgi:uncharacterized small protein (DUF1192 family)